MTFKVSVLVHTNMFGSSLDLLCEVAERVVGEGVAERCWQVTSEKWVGYSWCANRCLIISSAELVFIGISHNGALEWSKCSLVEGNLSLSRLRALVNKEGIFTIPDIPVIEAVDKDFVAVLHSHDELSEQVDLIDSDIDGPAHGINISGRNSRIDSIEVVHLNTEGNWELISVEGGLKVDESLERKQWGEVEGGIGEDVKAAPVH